MESRLPLGFHFKPTDEEILVYLFCRANSLPSPGEFLIEEDLRSFRIDQPPDIRRDGCLGRLYWYMDCKYKLVSGRFTRDRHTVDRKGYWKSTDGQKRVDWKPVDGQAPVHRIVGHKQDFRFHPLEPGREVSRTWVMTEYTIYSNASNENTKAICVLRNTKKD